MVYGRSFRQARDPDLVQRGKGMFRINGIWVRYGPLHLDVQGKRGSTQISFQGRKVGRRKELTESMPVLAEAPQGGKLVDGVPNERRRWLDELMLACEPGLHHAYQAYLRAMVQRSRLLRSHYGAAQLDAWEYQIVLHGLKLIQARASLLTGLNTLLADEQGLTEQGLSLQLASSVPVEEQAWLQALVAGRDQDRRMGRMLIGPHTDRVKVLYAGREIRSAGSRGQQKLAAIALRMAECGIRMQHRQITPVLLLDDCLEALDSERQYRLLERICRYSGQVLATAPSGVGIPKGLQINHQTVGHTMGEDARSSEKDRAVAPSEQTGKMEKAA